MYLQTTHRSAKTDDVNEAATIVLVQPGQAATVINVLPERWHNYYISKVRRILSVVSDSHSEARIVLALRGFVVTDIVVIGSHQQHFTTQALHVTMPS